MQLIASLLVGKPLNILAIAFVFLAGHLVLKRAMPGAGRSARPLLYAAVGWALYSAWEWLVLVKSPEADIRVDLLLILPALAIGSAVAIALSLFARSSGSRPGR